MEYGRLLSTFDLITLVISVAGACLLWVLRKINKREHAVGQWVGDAFTVGALVVVVAIGVYAVFGDVYGFKAVAKANAIIVAIAFIYSAGMLVRSLWLSAIKEPPKG